jgi:hypothetical protein
MLDNERVPLMITVRSAARPVVRAGRRALAMLRFGLALARLVLAARRGPVQFWIGDSHSVWLNRSWPAPPLSQAAPGRWVWHIGPRLMYSLARDGYPPAVHRVARLLRLTGAGRAVTPIFVSGEIDIRCHLAGYLDRPGGTDFVAGYVAAGRSVARAAGAQRVLFVVPVPPSDAVPDYAGFPVLGTLAERLTAFAAVRAELARAAAGSDEQPPAAVIDATADVSDAQGGLRVELSVDGCHLTPAGAQFVHRRLAELDAALAS